MSIIENIRTQAEQFLDIGNITSAKNSYREIIRVAPNDTDANYMLGVLSAEQGLIEDSLTFLNKAIELNPKYPDSYYMLAKINQVKGSYELALELCQKAVDLDPEFDEAWQLLCSLNAFVQDYEAAYTNCEKALTFAPASTQAHLNMANAAFIKHKFSVAANHYEKTIELDSSLLDAWKSLVMSLKKNNEFNKAIIKANAALERFPNNPDLKNILAEIYIESESLDEAENICQQLLDANENHVEALINLGNIYYQRRHYQKGIEIYEKALAISPDHANIYHNLGNAYFKLGNNSVASSYYKKALDIDTELSVTKHMLAVAEGNNKEERANTEYVTDLFDNYAHRYDEHQMNLEYRVPEHINTAIREIISTYNLSSSLDILDLGCGTGLCAPHIKDICNKLIGVDLSAEMVKKAEILNAYDELVVGDISELMNTRPASFDIIFAADVFVYVGKLDQEFESAYLSLRDHAFFVFSVQVNDKVDNFELTDTGRYNHAGRYITDLAKKNKLVEVSSKNIISRMDYGVPVNSRVHILQKK